MSSFGNGLAKSGPHITNANKQNGRLHLISEPSTANHPGGADFSATVTDIRLESREGAAPARWQMTLSRTEFAAGDTGVLKAVSRSGTRLEVPVLAVIEQDGDIWHIVEKPLAGGTDVTGRVTAGDVG